MPKVYRYRGGTDSARSRRLVYSISLTQEAADKIVRLAEFRNLSIAGMCGQVVEDWAARQADPQDSENPAR